MFVNQIAVYLQNENGSLDSLVRTIADANINLTSMNIADTSEFGIVRIITNDNVKALEVIKSAGFLAKSQDLVAIKVQDKPGRLARVLDVLKQEEIAIEYLYSYDQGEGKNLILFKTAETERAAKIVEGLNI